MIITANNSTQNSSIKSTSSYKEISDELKVALKTLKAAEKTMMISRLEYKI
jgi:hypothetical protein